MRLISFVALAEPAFVKFSPNVELGPINGYEMVLPYCFNTLFHFSNILFFCVYWQFEFSFL